MDKKVTNLRTIRKSKGMTQTALAEVSGVSPRMIAYYEQGIKDINKIQAMSLYKIAEALDCNMSDLLEL